MVWDDVLILSRVNDTVLRVSAHYMYTCVPVHTYIVHISRVFQ